MSMKTQKNHREMEPATKVTQMGFSMSTKYLQKVAKKCKTAESNERDHRETARTTGRF